MHIAGAYVMSPPLPDRYWQAAADAAVAALDEAELVLVPQEFLPLSDRFLPLEFSWGMVLRGRRVAVCCVKDDTRRISPALLATLAGRRHHRWANEVFVLGANFQWKRADRAVLDTHLGSWEERLQAQRRGVAVRPPQWRTAEGQPPATVGPRLLVVGASGMGNVGDDLLAESMTGLLRAAGAGEVLLSGPDVDPLHLRHVDGVVVGGGGLVYASRDGSREWQNLANYLRFGPMCREAGVPVAMIGVADQDHAGGITAHALAEACARHCLRLFDPVTTRDGDSAKLLHGLGTPHVTQGCDLVFDLAERARKAPRPTRTGPPRIALGGELFIHPGFERAMTAHAARLRETLQGREFEYLLMSQDDVPHGQRVVEAFRAAGASISIVDLRGHTIESLVYQFASLEGLITTRFHGVVLAALSGLPLLVLDGPNGKKARLLRELQAPPQMLVCSGGSPAGETEDGGVRGPTHDAGRDTNHAAHRILCALGGEFHALDARTIDAHAAGMGVHRQAAAALLARISAAKPQHSAARVAAAPPAPATAREPAPLPERLVDGTGAVGLCWAASTAATDGYGNLGDSLSAVVVSALAGLPVRHVHFDEQRTKLVAVGSIGHAIRGGQAVFWGTGVSIRGGVLPRNVPKTRYDVRAIRGAISGDHLRNLGIDVPEVYGDPVWLLPSIFFEPVEKKYELGVIPHIQDIAGHGPLARPPADSVRYRLSEADAGAVTIINTWHQPTWEGLTSTLRRILECKRVVSQSFHGVVIAEAYGIPALNFRQVPAQPNGLMRIDLSQRCTTDPRIHEFYGGGTARHFHLYAQRRDEHTDWAAVIDAVDRVWTPFEYDAEPLVRAFPLPLAYDPLRERLPVRTHLEALRF
jgi:pyruvyltransferase